MKKEMLFYFAIIMLWAMVVYPVSKIQQQLKKPSKTIKKKKLHPALQRVKDDWDKFYNFNNKLHKSNSCRPNEKSYKN